MADGKTIDLSKQKLPPIYMRKGKKCYLDPIREKLIYITPEETVRQQMISYLLNELKVPKKMIEVEVHLSHYGINSKRRVDILITKYDSKREAIVPLCVIECKAPSIVLGLDAQNQMLDYCDALVCDYAIATNGYDIQCFHYNEVKNQYEYIAMLPQYMSMVKGEFVGLPEQKMLPRLKYEELENNWEAYKGTDMGVSLEKKIGLPMVNLWECLIYQEHTLPKKKYKIFEVIEDLGIRILSYGNASGGMFQGPYRSFMIEYKGSTEIVSFGFSSYVTTAKPNLM